MSPATRALRTSTLLLLSATMACADNATPTSNPSLLRAAATPILTPQNSGTTNRLIGISPVNDQVAWASGTGGTYAVTTDGGATWHAGVVPGQDNLQFRDVQAFSSKVAYLLSIGNGEFSRIFKTVDGGATWTRQFQGANPAAFYDCFAFWDKTHALVMGDAINGRFPVLRTSNGRNWSSIAEHLPVAQPGEAAFAASGTCVATQGSSNAWIATGGAATARVLATTDGGFSWNAYATPIFQGTASSGVISIAFRDASHGILGGGELALPDSSLPNFARSSDGGVTWTLGTNTIFAGPVYGLAYVPGLTTTVVATGPTGAAYSEDEGDTWTLLPGAADYWAVAFASPSAGWMVGSNGRILKVSF